MSSKKNLCHNIFCTTFFHDVKHKNPCIMGILTNFALNKRPEKGVICRTSVKVTRHKACRIRYRDMKWSPQTMKLEDDLSELLQHEYDHLDGILAVLRAIDAHSFALRSQQKFL